MRVLAVNGGSSSLKCQLVDVSGGGERRLARGLVERIGDRAAATLTVDGQPARREAVEVRDHDAAIAVVLRWLRELGMSPGPDAVGHRIVHGGAQFVTPTVLDDRIVSALDQLEELAP